MKIRNFAEAQCLLNGFITRPLDKRAVYNLDTIQALMTFLGEPQNSLKVIHVAGTSGKTSTAYYTAALLRAAGKRVGLTVSPHIEQLNERVQIDGQPLSEATFCARLGAFMDEVRKSGLKPTYFELLIAFAYWEFARQQVDYAVVEVGLGGLLDGTNVVTRQDKICVITDIGLDHVSILGSTLQEIAAQKAGIIHPKNVVFMYEQGEVVMQAVRAVCERQQATLRTVAQVERPALRFLPLYQQRNITLAQAAAAYVLQRDERASLPQTALEQAATTRIPGRMEVFHIGDKTVILDGAHNAQKLQALIESMQTLHPEQAVAALVGFAQSKEATLPENTRIIKQLANRVITTTFPATQEHGQPSIDAETVAAAFQKAGATQVSVVPDRAQALQSLLAAPESSLLVTGSLYLIYRLRPQVIALARKS